MNRLLLTLASLLLVAAAGTTALAQNDNPVVLMETSQGAIRIELFPARAPETVANFLRYVDAGFYDGLIFHRVVRDFLIQTGRITPDIEVREPLFEPIPNEADSGLKNVRGTVAMGRYLDPQSATSEFFINTVDNPTLNHTGKSGSQAWGYAVFGQVIDGMQVVDQIRMQPTETVEPFEHMPVEPIIIQRIRRVRSR